MKKKKINIIKIRKIDIFKFYTYLMKRILKIKKLKVQGKIQIDMYKV